jgi:hypothetical protein
MGKYDDAENDALGGKKKQVHASNTGGKCAVNGCLQPATATSATAGQAKAKWYCTAHGRAIQSGASAGEINKITHDTRNNKIERHWADTRIDGMLR